MAKQMPMLATSVVSARLIRITKCMKRGTTSKPTARSATRNAASRPTVVARAPAERPAPLATAVRTAMSRIAIRSSMRRMPTTSSRSLPPIPCSSKALAMIVVLEMATTAPGNMLSSVVQPKSAADEESEPHHDAGLEDGGEAGGRPDAHQLAEAELEPEREHQEDDAELGQRLDDAAVGDQRDGTCGPDDEPGEDVAEHDRLAQPLEDDGRDGGDAEDDGQRPEELVHVVHQPGLGIVPWRRAGAQTLPPPSSKRWARGNAVTTARRTERRGDRPERSPVTAEKMGK